MRGFIAALISENEAMIGFGARKSVCLQLLLPALFAGYSITSTTHSLFVNWLCGEDDTLDFSRLGPGHQAFTEFAVHNALLFFGTIIPIHIIIKFAVCH